MYSKLLTQVNAGSHYKHPQQVETWFTLKMGKASAQETLANHLHRLFIPSHHPPPVDILAHHRQFSRAHGRMQCLGGALMSHLFIALAFGS